MKHKITDIIDVPRLQEVFNSLFVATGIPSALVDTDGNILTHSGWQDICSHFHRENVVTREICRESDLAIKNQFKNGNTHAVYHCPLGLVDSCCPVVIDGEHVASVFTGQFFHQPLADEMLDKYRRQAVTYGFDEEAYLAAVQKVPIIPMEKHLEILTFLKQFTQIIVDMANQSAALIQKKKKVQEVFRAIGEGLWELDLVSGKMEMSSKSYEILGHTDKSISVDYETFKLLIHPRDRKSIVEMFDSAVRDGVVFNQEFRLRRSDLTYAWVLCMGRVIDFDENSIPLKMVGKLTDISEKRSLKESFEKAFMYSPILMTLSEVETGRYLNANKKFYDVTGYTSEMVLGTTSVELGLISQKERNRLISHLGEKGRVENIRLELKKKNGEIFYSDYSGVIIDVEGENHLLSLAVDVTEAMEIEQEREEMQKMLRQTQKLEAIGTLAGGIAHDFNNILSAMIGYTDMAIEDTVPGSRTWHDLQNVMEAGSRARELVGQILTFSRQSETQKTIVKPSTVLKEAAKMLRSTLPSTIRIEMDISSPDSVVYADPIQLHQVIMNLCTNAYHAMQENGGVLTITQQTCVDLPDRIVRNAERSNSGYLQISVKDTGVGMNYSIIDRIFDPFFTTKAEGKGTGMGLAITYGIMTDLEGTVTVDSAPGRGSVFHLFIPLANADERLINVELQPLPTGKETILVVDDDRLLVSMNKEKLSRLGYTVIGAYGGNEALEIFEKDPGAIDLVITDYTMPEITGYDLSKRMLFLRSDIPIILCTGFSEKINESIVSKEGIRGFLYKPVLKRDLAVLVRQLLDQPSGKAHEDP